LRKSDKSGELVIFNEKDNDNLKRGMLLLLLLLLLLIQNFHLH